MAATIQVVLQQDVTNVGASGELVKVRPGYARNFLIPRALAVPATTAAVNRINHEKAVALAKHEKLKKEAQELAGKIAALEVTLTQRVGEEGRLFGAITTKDIEAAVKAKGFAVDRKKMQLPEGIKALGTYDIPVKLFGDIGASFKLHVVAK